MKALLVRSAVVRSAAIRSAIVIAAAAGSSTLAVPAAAQPTTLKAVMSAALRITDPMMTTAYITRDHGFMIYDTLFAIDSAFKVQPQMVDSWTVSDDQLTWTFRLRPGLKFHDGAPVTSDDVIASLDRWAQRDASGAKLKSFTAEMKAVDPTTFAIVLKEPFGLVLDVLAKPSTNIPFILPKRLATTPATQAITDYTGSGPFRFVTGEFQPGNKAVYEKFTGYVPRKEAPSWLAGGKQVNFDRVEWINIADTQTATNALVNGEIDVMAAVPFDMIPIVEKAKGVKVSMLDELGAGNLIRFNWLQPPLDNQKVRQAVLTALYQPDYLAAQVGNPALSTVCGAAFGCGTPLATNAGATFIDKPDLARARKLLKEGGYKGEKIVILQPTDHPVLAPLGLVTAQALRNIGMTVELASMDWQSVGARRARMDPVNQGGWHAFHTFVALADLASPLSNFGIDSRGKAGWFGWADVPAIEKLRDDYVRTRDPARQKAIAEQIQTLAYDEVTFVPLGQFTQPTAYRDTVKGLVDGPVRVFWGASRP